MHIWSRWIILAILMIAAVAVHNEQTQEDIQEDNTVSEPEIEELGYVRVVAEKYVFWEDFQENHGFEASEDTHYKGEWEVSSGFLEWGLDGEQGLVLLSKAAKHAISQRFNEAIEVKDQPLVVQYEVRLHKRLECGGAYMKLVRDSEGRSFAPLNFNDQDEYVIMFGPDKCGTTNKVHFIFKHKNPISGEYVEHHLTDPPKIKNDQTTALYTLVIYPDDTYEIFLNLESKRKGSLLEDFEPPVIPAKFIPDPDDSKPEDWVDDVDIPDPEAVKPENWDEDAPRMIPDEDDVKPEDWLDDEPDYIPDPEASKPEDWDDELDGDYEPPLIENPLCESVGCGDWKPRMIRNPEFKGKWVAPLIPNPDYVGEWEPRDIENPSYFEVDHVDIDPIVGLGFELWTMQDQIEFDNIYIGHDVEAALEYGKASWGPKNLIEVEHKAKKSKKDKGEGVKEQFQGQVEKLIAFAEQNPLPVIGALVVGLFGVFFLCSGSSEPEPLEPVSPVDDKGDNDADEKENEEESTAEETEKPVKSGKKKRLKAE